MYNSNFCSTQYSIECANESSAPNSTEDSITYNLSIEHQVIFIILREDCINCSY